MTMKVKLPAKYMENIGEYIKELMVKALKNCPKSKLRAHIKKGDIRTVYSKSAGAYLREVSERDALDELNNLYAKEYQGVAKQRKLKIRIEALKKELGLKNDRPIPKRD